MSDKPNSESEKYLKAQAGPQYCVTCGIQIGVTTDLLAACKALMGWIDDHNHTDWELEEIDAFQQGVSAVEKATGEPWTPPKGEPK